MISESKIVKLEENIKNKESEDFSRIGQFGEIEVDIRLRKKYSQAEIKNEEPVPLSNQALAESFNAVIAKASLLYERVQKHPEYQVAIFTNGSEWEPSETVVIYTSSIDGQAHIIKMDYSRVSFAEYGDWPRFKPSCLFVERAIMTGNKREAVKFGLLAHNGRMIVPPEFTDITPFKQSFVFCRCIELGMPETVLYDYNGVCWLAYNRVNFMEKKLNLGKTEARLIKADEWRPGLLAKNTDSRIYLVYKGELYSTLRYNSYNTMAVVGDSSYGYDDTFVIRKDDKTGDVLHRLTAGQIWQMSRKVYHGKKHEFYHWENGKWTDL